jgi:hypothetical protein
VGEQDDPVVADELMEVNRAGGGVGLEVGRSGAEAEAVEAMLATGGFSTAMSLQFIPNE